MGSVNVIRIDPTRLSLPVELHSAKPFPCANPAAMLLNTVPDPEPPRSPTNPKYGLPEEICICIARLIGRRISRRLAEIRTNPQAGLALLPTGNLYHLEDINLWFTAALAEGTPNNTSSSHRMRSKLGSMPRESNVLAFHPRILPSPQQRSLPGQVADLVRSIALKTSVFMMRGRVVHTKVVKPGRMRWA
jgi:hypothetical protein